jgi:alkylated DNA nucleotide flippase Atl1
MPPPQAGPSRPALPGYAERVLAMVETIPPGRVMSYGDIAGCLDDGGPRQVGRVLALWGGAVPWWRVTRADGSFLPGHEQRALERYQAEGTPLRAGAGGVPARVDMRQARWLPDPAALALPGPAALPDAETPPGGCALSDPCSGMPY